MGNRLNGTIEYYLSKTTNLLLDRQLPSIVGVKSVASNMGQVNNRGWEITLNSLNIDIKDKLQWFTNLSLSGYRNRIVHLYGDYDEMVLSRMIPRMVGISVMLLMLSTITSLTVSGKRRIRSG